MNRVHTMAFRLLVASLLVLVVFCSEDAGANACRPPSPESAKPRNQTGQRRRPSRIRLLLNRRRRYRPE